MFPLNLGINLSYMSVGSYYLLPRRIHTQFLPPVAMQVDLIYKELQVYATRHRVQPEGRGAGAGELQPDMCTSVRELINNLSNSANYVNMVAVQLDHQLTDCTEPNRTEPSCAFCKKETETRYSTTEGSEIRCWPGVLLIERERERGRVSPTDLRQPPPPSCGPSFPPFHQNCTPAPLAYSPTRT